VRVGLAALVVAVGFGLAGCSASTEAMDLAANERPSLEQVQDEEPTDAEIAQAQREAEADVTSWVCEYDPTMNRNWHDDVLCIKGNDSVRPNLRPNDRFVTKAEIMRAARAYEKKLNARR